MKLSMILVDMYFEDVKKSVTLKNISLNLLCLPIKIPETI